MKRGVSPHFASVFGLALFGFVFTASAQPNLNLPGGTYFPTITFSDTFTFPPGGPFSYALPSYFTTVFASANSGLPTGFDVVPDHTYLTWCVDLKGDIIFPAHGTSSVQGNDFVGTPLAFKLYNTSGAQNAFAQGLLSAISANPSAWNEVNYLLNHKGSASVGNIQFAIWQLIFGSKSAVLGQLPSPNYFFDAPSAVSDALVADAMNHSNFVPGPGETEAVLLDSHGLDGDPQDIIIEVTVPSTCTIPGVTISNTSWNKFNAPTGLGPCGTPTQVWIHAHIGKPNVPTTKISTVLFSGVSFSLNGIKYSLPDGLLTFDPSAPSTITTSFTGGRWETLVNPNFLSDEIFFTGAAIPVDTNISGGGKATLTYNVQTNDSNLSFSWQWSAAVFTCFPSDWNQAMIQPFHHSEHAGTPLNTSVQKSLIQGPRGGGGSNFTGSWSATGTGVCPAVSTQPQ